MPLGLAVCLAVSGLLVGPRTVPLPPGPPAGPVLQAEVRVGADGSSIALSPNDARLSLVVNREIIAVPQFLELTGATGRETVIALIDTGVDPSHLDLAHTPAGLAKIIDWQDFTGEGDVDTRLSAPVEQGGMISTPYGTVHVGEDLSAGGRLHYGLFRERQLDTRSPLEQDIDHNGRRDDTFLVLVADRQTAGVYDTVFVDTDGDLDLADERPLTVFKHGRSAAAFGREGFTRSTPFVVTTIDPDGGGVTLGFDGNGHGTHVAGICAGHGARSGGVTGVAPGARLMALKALGSSGDGNWANITRAMTYAAENGAQIIVVSVSPVGGLTESWQTQTRTIADLCRRHGVLFVLAGGNNGPGLGTLRTPGDPESALTVGGLVTPAMWQEEYGFDIATEGLWYFSAVGPRPDGSAGPSVLAPATAVAPVPYWLCREGYSLYEGTSMAAPHVAGAAALLLDAGRRAGLQVEPVDVGTAIEDGARPLAQLNPVEQGHGALHLAGAWRSLRGAKGRDPVQLRVSVPGGDGGYGVRARGDTPGAIKVTCANPSLLWRRFSLRGSVPWISTGLDYLELMPGSPRTVRAELRVPEQPGLYSERLLIDHPGTDLVDQELPITVVQPWRLTPAGGMRAVFTGQVVAGGFRRHFVSVPAGTTRLSVRLTAGSSTRPPGRLNLHVFGPGGREVLYRDVDGAAGSGAVGYEVALVGPDPGVYEFIVHSATGPLGPAGQGCSFRLELTGDGLVAGEDGLRFRLPFGGGRQTRVPLALQPVRLSTAVVLEATPPLAARPETGVERVTLNEGTAYTRVLPRVESGTAYLQVNVRNPDAPVADLALYLYRLDGTSGHWQEVRASARRGQPEETVELVSPSPGHYAVYVEAAGGVPGETGFDLQVLCLEAAPRPVGTGAIAPGTTDLAVDLDAPSRPGRYWGLVLVRDADTRVVGSVIPYTLDVGRPDLLLAVEPGESGSGRATFIAVDAGSRRPVDLDVRLNHRWYHAQGGRVSFPVTLGADGLQVAAVIDDPRYGYVGRTLTLPRTAVAPASGLLPPDLTTMQRLGQQR